MENLKPISHKEFNEFIKGKGFKGRNEYKLKDLEAKFGFKPMYDRRTLTISSEGMSPATFDLLRKASKATGTSYGVLIYAKNKERNFVKGELQRENKLISYKRAFKMLEDDMYIAGIGQAVLELLSVGNLQYNEARYTENDVTIKH